MLQKLGDHIANCFVRADDAERRAAVAPTQALRTDYEHMAKMWRHLAGSYQFVESLKTFLLDGEKAKLAPDPPVETEVPILPRPAMAKCLAKAADAERHAAEATNEAARRDHEQMAKNWRGLASSYQFVDKLEDFFRDAERRRAASELRDREERLHSIVDTVLDGIITIDNKGMIEDINPAAARTFGYTPGDVLGRNVNILMPEPFRREHDTYIENYLDTGKANVIGIRRELIGLRKDGTRFPMELVVSEIAVAGRQMFVGVVHDITRRVRNAERQRTLMAELDHRVKNVLARVAMLAASTRKGSTSIDEYARSLDGRIRSMAAAHTLLSQSGWQNVGLGAVVQEQLAPYATGSNATITGEDIKLSPAEIQAVAMVLHELVTNAAKYGSLSVPNGRVCVTWNGQNLDEGETLVLQWREIDGPPVPVQVPSGYGTSLIRDLIPHELGGTVDLVFAPDGVNCKIEVPLENT